MQILVKSYTITYATIKASFDIVQFVQGYSQFDYIDANSHNLDTKTHATAKSIISYNTVDPMIPMIWKFIRANYEFRYQPNFGRTKSDTTNPSRL